MPATKCLQRHGSFPADTVNFTSSTSAFAQSSPKYGSLSFQGGRWSSSCRRTSCTSEDWGLKSILEYVSVRRKIDLMMR